MAQRVILDVDKIDNRSLYVNYDNGKDKIKISIMGSDANPIVQIYVRHLKQDDTIDSGVIAIPFHPLVKDMILDYIKPFAHELLKYAK